MSESFASQSSESPEPSLQIQQELTGNRNQAIGQVLGGIVVYVSGGQAIFQSPGTDSGSVASKPTTSDIGPNPYKGLMAFQETDGDRFFGREKQIAALWERLRHLHETESAIRVLLIYGPSGSGKSSLARAGLIPELAHHPISEYARARVAILVPGTHPLESLATVLARIVTQDLTPVAKTREFAGELKQSNETGEYDGLRRIADVMPDIAITPLVVLVDQFEEVYTLCKDAAERDAFVGNLLNAASDRAKRVMVIVTLRSDFLGETQKHSLLNRLFTEQGYLVPAMNEAELREAIRNPAKKAGYFLDEATIDLLVKDTEGRDGALPLLQFALTRIWEGLVVGKQPAETLKEIGGVGGALAGEAQRIYDTLSAEEQEVARRVFLGLVQLGEGTKDTRRRTSIDHLVSYREQPEQVKRVIDRFAEPGVRLLTLAAAGTTETAEVTHEALFEHWQQFQNWLEGSRSDIRFQRRLDDAAQHWHETNCPEGDLWRPPALDLLRQFHAHHGNSMTPLQKEFFSASVNAEDARQRDIDREKKEKRRQQILLVGASFFTILVTGVSLIYFLINNRINSEAEARADKYIEHSREINELLNKLLGPQASKELSESKKIAIETLDRWQIYKQKVFAPPFDIDLAEKYLEESFFLEKQKDIRWLIQEKSYYTYQQGDIKEVLEFVSFQDTIILSLRKEQKRTYCKIVGGVAIPQSIPPQRTAHEELIERYKLKRINGVWKIANYATLNKNWSKDNSQKDCSLKTRT